MDSYKMSDDCIVLTDGTQYPHVLIPWIISGREIILKSALQPQQYYRTIPCGYGIASGVEWEKMINDGIALNYFVAVGDDEKQNCGSWSYIGVKKCHGYSFFLVKNKKNTDDTEILIWGVDDNGECLFFAKSPDGGRNIYIIHNYIGSNWESNGLLVFWQREIIPSLEV